MILLLQSMIIIIAYLLSGYICDYTRLLNFIEEKIDINKININIIIILFILIMICMHYLLVRYSINKIFLQSIQLFITAIFIYTISTLKKRINK